MELKKGREQGRRREGQVKNALPDEVKNRRWREGTGMRETGVRMLRAERGGVGRVCQVIRASCCREFLLCKFHVEEKCVRRHDTMFSFPSAVDLFFLHFFPCFYHSRRKQ